MKKINIIGCGRLGKALGRLWVQQGHFSVGDVLNRSLQSGQVAVDFLDQGRPISVLVEMHYADLFMIATGDDDIEQAARQLQASGHLRPGNVVFHCSGALSSEVLAGARDSGAHVASVHPIKSFANPQRAVDTFAGTFCGMEGDEAALTELRDAVTAIGGQPLRIAASQKPAYHAGGVFISNYLTALLEVGAQAYARAGLSRAVAMQVMEPIARDTLDNVFALGPVEALTGPIARGDVTTVQRQLDALREWDPRIADIYQTLGMVTLALAHDKGQAPTAALSKIAELLARLRPDRA